MRYTTTLMLAGLFCLSPHFTAVAQNLGAGQTSNRYQQCIALTNSNPSQALLMADEWARTSNLPSAHHCRCVSLFALERYADAGAALEHLSRITPATDLVLWSNILRQAARAWALSGDKARAIVALTQAIHPTASEGLNSTTLARLATELLIQRSTLYRSSGRDLYALQDLDQALSLTPNHADALIERATLLLQRHAYQQAKDDINALVTHHPKHPKTLALARKIQ